MPDELPPLPRWNLDAKEGYVKSGLDGLRAYEDSAVRRVLTHLDLVPMANRIARAVRDVTGVHGCTFPAMDEVLHFPVKFGVGRISGVKFLAIPDLFDRWTTTALHKNLAELADVHGADAPLALVFRYTGDTRNPGPRGGRFMCLHTFPSTPILDRTRVVRTGRLGSQRVTFTLEVLEALMASFQGWGDHLRG